MRVQTWETKESAGIGFQERAVVEEYRKAKVVGHTTLVQGIRSANPDLIAEFDKVDKAL